MTKIISLIEKIGSSAELKKLTADEIKALFKEHSVVLNAEQTLVNAVEEQLAARTNVVCGIFPAEEPTKEQPDEEPGNDDDAPESRLAVNA